MQEENVESVGDTASVRRPGRFWRIIIIMVVVVVLVTAAVLAVVLLNNKNTDVKPDSGDDLVNLSSEGGVEAVPDEGYSENAIAEKIAGIEAEIKEDKSNAEEASLYVDLANRLFESMENTGTDYRERILEAVHKAYELDQNLNTAYGVYLYESTFGNEEEAAKYYDIALGYGMSDGSKGQG